MTDPNQHWTNREIDRFVSAVSFDFVTQIAKIIKAGKMNQDQFAEVLGRSKSRVSQLLNDPGNLRLETIVAMARGVGLKVSVVAYDDNDPDNNNGPVNSGIFESCWSNHGKPTVFGAIATWIDVRTTNDDYMQAANDNTVRVPIEELAKQFDENTASSGQGTGVQ